MTSYFQFKPHSITDRAWWTQVSEDSRTRDAVKSLRELRAEKTFIRQPLASEFLAARRSNDRGILDRYWHSRIHLAAATVERCADGDAGSVDDFLLDQLWSHLTCPTWVVSAHLPYKDLPLTSAPQLDLSACEMAGVLGETLEVLKPWIEAQSSTLADSIIYEIDRRVLEPFTREEPASWWYSPRNEHISNWAGVCAGSILAACEALASVGHPRTKARDRAIDVLNLFLQRGFTRAGECDEGVGYWAYGLGFACAGWSRLPEAEFRQKVDQQRLRTIADYPRRVHINGDWFYSGNDAQLRATAPLFMSTWLAAAMDSEWMTGWSRHGANDPTPLRSLPIALRILESRLRLEPGGPTVPPTEPVRYLVDQQVGIFQNGKLHITLDGGNNAERHNHNDIGHINVWVGDQLIVPDMGAPTYAADFFGPNRYTYLSASSRGHCCPIVNGVEQREGKEAQGRKLELDLQAQRVLFDLTSAYPAEADLKKWTRGVSRSDGGYVLSDEFVTGKAGRIENVFWSRVEPQITPGGATMGPVKLSFEPAGEVVVEAHDPKQLRLRDIKDKLYRIAVRYETTAGTPLRVMTRMSF